MTNQEQINFLNTRVKTRLAPSAIHGIGVFAIRDIPAYYKLNLDAFPQVFTLPYSQFPKLLPEVRAILLERFPSVTTGRKFTHPTERTLCFVNHSDNHNYDAETDLTVQKIKAGEEITGNYKLLSTYPQIFPWLS